ncbi:MAG: DUF2760 domain-containing protein [Pirellula sp.]|nr:DUF2760 domain-containing protein [Pirellula sp.]
MFPLLDPGCKQPGLPAVSRIRCKGASVGRISTAFRAFFRALGDADLAKQIDEILASGSAAAGPASKTAALPAPVVSPKPAPPKAQPSRSDALSLLSALQREARLVDFLKEKLDGYSDAQIGAAARDVHRDSGTVLERMFALRPLTEAAEGAALDVAAGFDPLRYQLTGNVVGQPPFHGTLRHHGWEATKCELPAWTGGEAAQKIVAPMEVEVR